ncbi:classical arabinogalactan protein 2-like [Chenopodium quinoa]|uniref:classical arabinogalactan protein 2-like n=1 Tax=Chenopodium quinoa TaxID=63459 RepID=UPI000B787CB4|nr:classical arabinogalactan protein 2-like [Chenopodium quinoa]
MGLSRVTLALTLIVVLVGSAIAQGPVMAPSQAPTTLSTPVAPVPAPVVVVAAPVPAPVAVTATPVAPPVEATADAPVAETPTMAAMTPTDVTMDGPSMAPAPGPDGVHDDLDGHDHNGAFLHGSSLALIAALGAVAVFA